MSFRGLPFRRRRPWTLTGSDTPAFDIIPTATEIELRASAAGLMREAAAPLLELALRARHVEVTMDLGAADDDLLVFELLDVRDLSIAAGPMLRRALEAHGRDVGYVTDVWHQRAAELTGAILDDRAGTLPAELAAEAGLKLSLAVEAARRDRMAVPGHLTGATGRVDAVRALSSALLRDHRG
jgi:hypothetical protein